MFYPNFLQQGLERFLEAATDVASNDGEDIVLAFCRSSPECEEILHILEAQGRKTSEVGECFERTKCKYKKATVIS